MAIGRTFQEAMQKGRCASWNWAYTDLLPADSCREESSTERRGGSRGKREGDLIERRVEDGGLGRGARTKTEMETIMCVRGTGRWSETERELDREMRAQTDKLSYELRSGSDRRRRVIFVNVPPLHSRGGRFFGRLGGQSISLLTPPRCPIPVFPGCITRGI